ncbi:MAG: serine/threonine protein kinase [Bifidobacteriaceae bacterium]|nr:serine/threonine protein kinase [Bifidobacteriaceae bacterium]MCI1978871.1 serine/threonine protein kinase [Bifidobacteriaceae bacterium]
MTAPPQLAGYRFIRVIGSGGTADVYLYEQQVPQRRVAIKVDKFPLEGDAARRRFHTEANTMARLAAHPTILTLYDASVTPDGHGYLVLEYAPAGNYEQLSEKHPPTPRQVLDVGVRVCGALYTAHHAGILHHDVKPTNILVSQQGTPLLADFGISSPLYDPQDSGGYSPLWAAPEVLREHGHGDEKSDIYSLAATLIGLLRGRSPFVLAFEPRSRKELENTVLTKELPPFNRIGLPKEWEQPFRKALDKNPENRHYSALEFARDLQRIQHDVYGSQTPVEARGAAPYLDAAIARVESTESENRPHPPSRHMEGHHHKTTQSLTAWPKIGPIIMVITFLMGVASAAWFFVLQPNTTDAAGISPSRESTQITPTPTKDGDTDIAIAPTAEEVPSPHAKKNVINGTTATFEWTNPAPTPKDAYFWKRLSADGSVPNDASGSTTKETTLQVGNVTASQLCLQVSLVRSNRQMSRAPLTLCATRAE